MTDIILPEYEIEHFNKQDKITITGGIIDLKSSPLALIGKLTPNYGSFQSQNFIWLMEHFANEMEPNLVLSTTDPKGGVHANGYYRIKPVVGMVYYNTVDKALFVCADIYNDQEYLDKSDVFWKKIMTTGTTKPQNPSFGDIWFDGESNVLKCYNGEYWVIIGPTGGSSLKLAHATGKTYNGASQEEIIVRINEDENEQFLFPYNTTSLVEVRIVAQENGTSPVSTTYRNSMGLIIKALIQSDANGQLTIVGDQNIELIGKTDTDYTKKWFGKIIINNNYEKRFGIKVGGVVSYASSDPTVNCVDWDISVRTQVV